MWITQTEMKMKLFVIVSSLSVTYGYSTGLFGGSSPWIDYSRPAFTDDSNWLQSIETPYKQDPIEAKRAAVSEEDEFGDPGYERYTLMDWLMNQPTGRRFDSNNILSMQPGSFNF